VSAERDRTITVCPARADTSASPEPMIPDPRIRPGAMLEVEIVDALDYDLVAEVRGEAGV
jgi:hypothetical protein